MSSEDKKRRRTEPDQIKSGYILVPTLSLCPPNPSFLPLQYNSVACCQQYLSPYVHQGLVYEDAALRENYSAFWSMVPPLIHSVDQSRRNRDYGEMSSYSTSTSVGIENSLYKMIPPPPSFPIINPVVYSNNCDVGTQDLEYISTTDFRLLNTRTTPVISIPRPSSPLYPLSPQDLIPSLIHSPAVKGCDNLKGDSFRMSSPSSMYVSSYGDTKLNDDKLYVIGFTWNPEPVRGAFDDDPWII